MAYIQKSYQKKFGNKDNSMETNIIEDVTYLVEKANNTPAYKVYTALLTQSGTDAPVATVLENTIGDIIWSYDGDGYSIGTSDGLFTLNKTWMVINGNQDGGDDFRYVMSDAEDTNQVYINTFKINSSGVKIYYSDMLKNTPIEIRVYN